MELAKELEMRGGFFPGMDSMFGQQKQEATMMPMQGDYGMMGGPVSQGMQSGYKGQPMDDGGMQMDNYDMSTGKYESTVAARPASDNSALVKRLRQKINKIDESDMPSKDKREMVRQLEKQIEELQMRGGDGNPELIRKIKAEISRLKNMKQTVLTERKIQEFEGHLKKLMTTGGRTSYMPTTTSSRGGVVYHPRDPMDSVVTSKKGGRKPSARGAIVKKVMQERGLTLPQASKYVKEKGLY
jgi:hypothetical protein